MPPKQIIPFKITSIDSLGQGVSKLTGKVVFIPKTALGDEGEAEILTDKKSIAFAGLKKLQLTSPSRIHAACPHFGACPSCHFLHINYDTELSIKKNSLEQLFRHQKDVKIELVPAPRRLEYRNRVQLHYDRRHKLLGMLDARRQVIIPVPQCQVGLPEIQSEIQRLYHEEQWLKEVPPRLDKGHVEIYWKDGVLKTSWNRPYADGGFTQVFQEMNENLKNILQDWQKGTGTARILDLFAGNGNLSSDLSFHERLCADVYFKDLPGEDFISQDLYEASALNRIKKELKKKNWAPDLVILDPPRSGLKNLHEWLECFRPTFVAYVSCDPHTLARDLASVKEYQLARTYLLDFFPSTYHFETMVILERKN